MHTISRRKLGGDQPDFLPEQMENELDPPKKPILHDICLCSRKFKEKLTFSVLVANPEKLLYLHGGQPAGRGLLDRERRTRRESHTARSEKIIEYK